MAEVEHVERPQDPVPEPGEAVHLPGPSYLPVLTAFAITIALVGIVISWVLVAIGVVLFAVVATRWVRQTREEISELPLEH
jgi:membrane protein implicated in regulation of membrane protease activity